MLGRLKFDLTPVINDILNHFPADKIASGRILDPAMAGGQIIGEIERRKRAAGLTNEQIAATVYGIEENILRKNYAVNKNKLSGTFSCDDFLTKEYEMKQFDMVLMNPPYTNGQEMLYAKFFEKALDVADVVVCIMPLDLDTRHQKLKNHIKRVKRHTMFVSENISDYFNVSYKNLHYVIASKNVNNDIEETADPLDSIALLYPERARLKCIKGAGDLAMAPEDPNGSMIVHKVHQNDQVIYKRVDTRLFNKSRKKSVAPYLVFVNHTPSQGKFNCVVLPNLNLSWSMWTFAFEADSLEQAEQLKSWLQSEEIRQHVNQMLTARNHQHTISKAMIDRLPAYAG